MDLVKFAGLRKLGLTEFVRNQHILKHMLQADTHSPIHITKHGKTVCVAMTEDLFWTLCEDVGFRPTAPSIHLKKEKEPQRGPPQAPFQ